MHRSLLLLTWLLLALPATQTLADSTQGDADPASREERPPATGMAWLHGSREGLRHSTYWLLSHIDGWFGDKPFEEGGEVGGRLRLRGLHRADEGFKGSLRFRLQVHMPNLDEKAYLFFGRDNEEELIDDRPETFSRSQLLLPENRREDETFFAGVGYHLLDNVDLRLGVRGGYKVYAQARYGVRWWLSDRASLEFRETLFVAVSDGVGATSALDYTHALSERLVFRWRNAGTFGSETDGLRWSSAAGLFQVLGDRREMSLELLANGESGRRVGVGEYGLRGIYRQPVYRDWLVGEVILGHFWPRDEDDNERQKAWALGLGVEMAF
ncbi:MAG: hypothetical protein ACLFSG_05470 [Halothiobacillaceae bacterium]